MKSRLIEFLCGTVEFSVSGHHPERFLNVASRENLNINDIRRVGDELRGTILASRYKRVRKLSRRSGTKVRLKSKRGLPFRLLPYRKRAGFVLGAVLFWGLLFYMSQFIWFIEYPLLPQAASEELHTQAEYAGLRTGLLRSNIDNDAIVTQLELETESFKSIKLDIMGCRITVHAEPVDDFVPFIDDDTPCNVVAKCAGVIEKVEAMEGVSEVKKGDVVAQGDLLISGVSESAMNTVTMHHAWGRVLAKTDYVISSTVPVMQTERLETGRRVTRRRLILFGMEIPLFFSGEMEGDFECSTHSTTLTIADVELPLTVIEEEYTEMETATHMITFEEAKARAWQQVQEDIAALSLDQILEQNEYWSENAEEITCTVSLHAIEDIARQEMIFFE